MTKKILLIEIGTEELPSKLLYNLSLCFYKNFTYELNWHNITYENIKHFSTPRRLALLVTDIDTKEKIIEIKKRGPSVTSAFDKNGLPTEAAKCWSKHCGINIHEAERIKNKNGEWLIFCQRKKQEKIELLLPNIIESALKKITFANTMRWTENNEKFSRPIRNIVILLDNNIIPGKIFNISSSNFLHNHLSSKRKKIQIQHAKEYPLILFQKNNIIADYETRKKTIIKKITNIAQKIDGIIKISNFLIEEVTALVESPTALLAQFQKKFLKIPKKILIHTIEKQQKCFPIYNKNKEIIPYFVFISNIDSKEPQNIILGNEKVMHARLSDTAFFFNKDRQKKLLDYLPLLEKVLFQNTLGSLYEKTMRLKSLVQWIALYSKSNITNSIQAAILSKCDLVTDMVCEFPELQGTIGMYYSLEDKEKKDISIAIKEQYLPSFSGDNLPGTIIGSTLSIADKMDTLSGMFSIGKNPSSDKDPFALRRLSIGILRIIIINNIPLDLKDLIKKSLNLYNKKDINNIDLYNKIIKFFMVRLFHWYEETGYNVKIVKSVLSCKLTQPIDIHYRVQAVSYFHELDCSKSTILSIKRISNILEKNNEKISGNINIHLIKEIEEKILLDQVENFINQTKKLFIEKKYKKILFKINELEKPIKNFFNKVQINHNNPQIRINRLILLKKLEEIFSKIANFSYLF